MLTRHVSVNQCQLCAVHVGRPTAQVDLSLSLPPPRRPDTVSPACFITCWMMPRFRSPGIIATPTAATHRFADLHPHLHLFRSQVQWKKRSERRENCARAGCSKVRTPPAHPPVANTHTHRQDRLQYTAPQLASTQCNNIWNRNDIWTVKCSFLCALQRTSSWAFPENLKFLSLIVHNLQPSEISEQSYARRQMHKIAPR